MTISTVDIDRVVEFCLTHIERYSFEPEPDAVKLNPDDHFWMTVRPDRIKPGELLPASAEHRRKRIEAWKLFARAALGDGGQQPSGQIPPSDTHEFSS